MCPQGATARAAKLPGRCRDAAGTQQKPSNTIGIHRPYKDPDPHPDPDPDPDADPDGHKSKVEIVILIAISIQTMESRESYLPVIMQPN